MKTVSNLTNVRTYVQFSQNEQVKAFIYNGNKLQAMNCFKYGMGVKIFSVLNEYKTDSFLPETYYTETKIQ